MAAAPQLHRRASRRRRAGRGVATGAAGAGAAGAGAAAAAAAAPGVRGIGCRRQQRRRLFGLLESDIDDVVLVLAERVDIDIADQRDFHRGEFAFDLLIDRCDVRRRRQLGVRQIEVERRR